MYLKINFTASTNVYWAQRLVAAIVQTSSITDISSLQSLSSSWRSEMLNIDWDTSEIFRSNSPDDVVCSSTTQDFSTSAAYDTYGYLNFRFNVYDDADTKYWVSFGRHTAGQDRWMWYVGDDASSVADSTNLLNGRTPTQTPDYTPGVLSGGQLDTGQIYSAYNNNSDINSIIVYLTDTCLIWASTRGVTNPTGYGDTYSNGNNFAGPFIFSQYTRYDHWNKSSNDIIPLAYTQHRNTGIGLRHSDFNQVNLGESSYTAGWKVFNLVEAQPKVGSDYPMRYFEKVHWGSGLHFTEIQNLQSENNRAGATAYASSYGALVRFEDYYRYPSEDLKDLGFAMHPIQVRNSRYGFGGGNLSDQSGIYLFNGNYYPGDEFVYNNKTYAIIPTFDGYSNRVGIAVPKE